MGYEGYGDGAAAPPCAAPLPAPPLPPQQLVWGKISEAKPRKPGKYLGILQVYPGFSRYTRNFANFADFGTKTASDSAQSQKIDDFHGVFSLRKIERKREGAVEKHGKETRRGERGNMYAA